LETKLFFVSPQPKSGIGNLRVVVSRSQTFRYTHTHTQSVGLLWMGDQLVTESANYAARYRHNRGAPMRSSGFEPAIPARERPQTHALDRVVTGSAL